MRLVGRLILLPVALLVAALAAGAVLLSIGQEQVVRLLRAGASDDVVFGLLGIALKLGLVLLTPQVAAMPLLIAIGGEVGHIRAAAFYVAAFGAFGALLPVLAGIDAGAAGALPVWALFATAGFAAGLVYWLVAGRTA